MRRVNLVLDHILFWATAASAMASFAVVLAAIVIRAGRDWALPQTTDQ